MMTAATAPRVMIPPGIELMKPSPWPVCFEVVACVAVVGGTLVLVTVVGENVVCVMVVRDMLVWVTVVGDMVV